MSGDSRDYEKEYGRLVDGIAESVLEMSDEEVLEELRAEGKDPDEVAERGRGVMSEAVRRWQEEVRT